MRAPLASHGVAARPTYQVGARSLGHADAALELIVATKSQRPDIQIERLARGPADERDLSSAAASVVSLEGRILDGNVGALVIVEGLGGHKHFEPLVAAARQTGTPLAYGDTAGMGALRKAFREIEQKLGRP